ncbi:hypothetical protein CDO11_23430 [Xanthomonas oryzae pv. oryzae]|nr:hypothetical protein PXO_05438 [Xanthomonas oryzae pv. oryzae PXO99A]AXI19307.1 hypothetical protein CDO19_23405 [Xanthomonas oryzae pv. oryzae]AXI23298.1 hypothetical protein CDO11_23430 [Xanthomonas oryzae pv. oryzae]
MDAMTHLKARRKRRRRSTTQRMHERDNTSLYTFGATLEQIDRFYALLRTISAQSDMVAVCGAPLDETTIPTLGESIFNAAREVRGLVDTVYTQRLDGNERPERAGPPGS